MKLQLSTPSTTIHRLGKVFYGEWHVASGDKFLATFEGYDQITRLKLAGLKGVLY